MCVVASKIHERSTHAGDGDVKACICQVRGERIIVSHSLQTRQKRQVNPLLLLANPAQHLATGNGKQESCHILCIFVAVAAAKFDEATMWGVFPWANWFPCWIASRVDGSVVTGTVPSQDGPLPVQDVLTYRDAGCYPSHGIKPVMGLGASFRCWLGCGRE